MRINLVFMKEKASIFFCIAYVLLALVLATKEEKIVTIIHLEEGKPNV